MTTTSNVIDRKIDNIFAPMRKREKLLEKRVHFSEYPVMCVVDYTFEHRNMLLVDSHELGLLEYKFDELGLAMFENVAIRDIMYDIETNIAEKSRNGEKLTDGEQAVHKWLLSR